MSSSIPPLLSPSGQNAAWTVRDGREREKKQMSDLNDRLANYIEKVRFLEAQNRKLATDLELVHRKLGKDAKNIKVMYEGELTEALRVMSEINQKKKGMEKQLGQMRDESFEIGKTFDESVKAATVYRYNIQKSLEKLSKLENEINLMRRRICDKEERTMQMKNDNQKLIVALQSAKTHLDRETLGRIDYRNQAQTLEEEIGFIKRMHEGEVKELQSMATRDTTEENRDLFKKELSSAIRDIRTDYDQMLDVSQYDIESWYRVKVQEICTQSTRQSIEQNYAKEEIRRLRSHLGDLRGKLADFESRNLLLEKSINDLNFQIDDGQSTYDAALNDRDVQLQQIREKCETYMLELQMLLSTKQTLDTEIAIFKKMLDGEENRAGLRKIVEEIVKTNELYEQRNDDEKSKSKSDVALHTSFQRSTKGNISIQEASHDGHWISIQNINTTKDEEIGGWKLKRKIGGKKEIIFTFPDSFIMRAKRSVKIFARNQGMPSSDCLVHESEASFGIGPNVQTILYNKEGELRAEYVQRSNPNY